MYAICGAFAGAVIYVVAGLCSYASFRSSFSPLWCVFWAVMSSMFFALLLLLCDDVEYYAVSVASFCVMEFHALTDYREGYICDGAVIVSILAGLVIRTFVGGTNGALTALRGAVAGGLPVAAVVLLTHGAMGWGDVTMMAGLGAILGWRMALLTLYAGVVIGGVCSFILLLARRVKRRDALPLAPFLLAGLVWALFFGASFAARLGLVVSL